MLSDRLAISALLIPVALWVIHVGGWFYLLGILLIFLLASLEYARLFHAGGHRPARPLIVGISLLLIASEHVAWLNPGGVLVALAVVGPLAWHLVDFERGAHASGTDFAVTVAGIFYLGGLGRYFVALRALPPDGKWWLLAVITSVWLADTSAYAVGRVMGRHKMAPRLSPKKTWEGYAGSVLGGALGGGLLSLLWHLGAGPGSLLNWHTGTALGALAGVVGQVGDLGVSMLKRQIGVKDSGALLAGHGGALDRMDSWIIAVTAGYFFVLLVQAL
jgi:phosphatidate cytidylyltransferase